MKLYTEEQLRKAINDGSLYSYINGDFEFKNSEDDIINSLTPIELPSDEEIEDKGKWAFNDAGHTIFTHYNTVPSWVDGAKWMRDKIQGGKNEQQY